jgi:hypothetical protein
VAFCLSCLVDARGAVADAIGADAASLTIEGDGEGETDAVRDTGEMAKMGSSFASSACTLEISAARAAADDKEGSTIMDDPVDRREISSAESTVGSELATTGAAFPPSIAASSRWTCSICAIKWPTAGDNEVRDDGRAGERGRAVNVGERRRCNSDRGMPSSSSSPLPSASCSSSSAIALPGICSGGGCEFGLKVGTGERVGATTKLLRCGYNK